MIHNMPTSGARGSARLLIQTVMALVVIISAGIAWADGFEEKEVKKLGPFPVARVKQHALSPDGDKLVYVIEKEKMSMLVYKGKEGIPYDAILDLSFSPDGRRVGFTAVREGGYYVVINGVEGKKYDRARGPVFSPDGKTTVYHVTMSGRGVIVFNDDFRKKYSAQTQELPIFSPNGKHLAYEGRSGGSSRRFSVPNSNSAADPNGGSPDGTESGVTGGGGGPRLNFVVRDEKKRVRSNDVRYLVYSPDSRRLANATKFAKKWFMVVDDTRVGRLYDDVSKPVFSPNGRRLAYAAELQGKWFSVLGTKEGNEHDGIRCVTFSPDSKQLVYAVRDGRRWKVVCGERESIEYDYVYWIHFSPDGKHLVFMVRKRRAQFLVIDGVAAPAHARILFVARGITKKRLRYVAIDNEEARLVELKWPSETDYTKSFK